MAHPDRTFAEERRAAILAMLDRSTSVQVADLAHTFGVSMVTARGDLDALDAAAKQAIARAALELVDNGDSLLVDSGTTALELVRLLGARSGITVITADVTIANFVDESLPDTDVILLGGALRKGHRYLYGPLALRALEVLHANKAFLCPTSLVPGRGLMTNFEQMAELKRAFIEASGTSIALLDASKVGAGGLMRVAELQDIDLVVMDYDPEGTVAVQIRTLAKAGLHAPRVITSPHEK